MTSASEKLFDTLMEMIKGSPEEEVLKTLNGITNFKFIKDRCDSDGRGLVLQCVVYSKRKVLKFFLQKEFNPNIGNYLSYDSLYYAAKGDDPEIVKLLIQHGANTRKSYGEGQDLRTILSESSVDEIHNIAYEIKNLVPVKIEEEDDGFIDLDDIDTNLETKIADKELPKDEKEIKRKSKSAVIVKGDPGELQKGQIKDKRTFSKTESSTDLGTHVIENEDALTKKGDFSTSNLINYLPEGAIDDKDLPKSHEFLNGATNDKGQNILMLACLSGDLEAVKKLVSHGVDFHVSDYNGDGCLTYAVNGGNIEILEWLIERGVKVRSKNMHGLNPLFYAFKHKRLDMFHALLKAGSSTKVKYQGTPLLTLAVKKNLVEFVKLLLDAGADTKIRDLKYKRAIDYAQKLKLSNLENILMNYEKSKTEELENKRADYMGKKNKKAS